MEALGLVPTRIWYKTTLLPRWLRVLLTMCGKWTLVYLQSLVPKESDRSVVPLGPSAGQIFDKHFAANPLVTPPLVGDTP
jgi:hypothetical protein